MRERSIEVVRVDITPPDIAALGFHVVRAVAPRLQPMEANFSKLMLIPKRFADIGDVAAGTRAWRETLNPFPHPIA
jgi:uncharacterized RDD family membrane protein YckC